MSKQELRPMASLNGKRWFYPLFICSILLSNISPNGFAEKIIVSRTKSDLFGYDSANVCSSWCGTASGFLNLKGVLFQRYSCNCQCENGLTFLIYKRKCFSINNLKTSEIFGNGLFLFDKVADLHAEGSFDTKQDCRGCQVDTVMYLYYDQWMNTSTSAWTIVNIKSIKWNSTTLTDLDGKIIKIQLRGCKHKSNKRIFIKAKGNYFVDFASPSTSVIHTYISKSSIVMSSSTTKTSLHASVTPALTSTTDVSIITTAPPHTHTCTISSMCLRSQSVPFSTPLFPGSSSPLTRQTPPATPQPTSTLFATISTTATLPSPTKERTYEDEPSAPTGAIIGAVMAFIVVVVIVLLIVFWRRRQKKSSPNEDEVKEKKLSKDNPTYGGSRGEVITLSQKGQQQHAKGTDNEFEYDYAAVDGDPRSHGNRSSNGTAPQIYQSLDPTRDSVYTPLNRNNSSPSDQMYTYNQLERPGYNPPRNVIPDPLYNVLDRPDDNGEDYIEPGVQIKKPYNKKPNPKQAPQNNEPLYNVLEYPHQVGGKEAHQDEPDYSVLEDPSGIGGKEASQEDEPDYNVLEDPDGDYDNAPVETDMRHPSSHDNVGYASTIDIKSKQNPGTQRDPVYSVLEGPEGSLSEGTYQPLQIKVPDESMYQPLDRTSQFINDQPLYQVLEDKASMSNA